MSDILGNYTATIKRKFKTGEVGEHAYRGALKKLFESLGDLEKICNGGS